MTLGGAPIISPFMMEKLSYCLEELFSEKMYALMSYLLSLERHSKSLLKLDFQGHKVGVTVNFYRLETMCKPCAKIGLFSIDTPESQTSRNVYVLIRLRIEYFS